jgi:hypothetical protein
MLLDTDQSMTSIDIVHTGANMVTLIDGKYSEASGAYVNYRHAATYAGVATAEWQTYSTPFMSLGYVQVQVSTNPIE